MPPEFIDTHCHLTMPQFDVDRREVIRRARDAGVTKIITVCTDIDDSKKAIGLAEEYEFINASAGIHPHDVKDIKDPDGIYRTLRELASNKRVVALGETGLDYHYNHSPPNLQQEHFRMEIGLAKAVGLPLIVHSREAGEDTLRILREERAQTVGGVLHCFSGDMGMANEALDMGFHISFSGVVTFKNARRILDIAEAIPLDRILIETDAPYLTPHPYRGKRNEPAYVAHVAGKVAEVKGMSIEDLAGAVLDNAARLFKLSPAAL